MVNTSATTITAEIMNTEKISYDTILPKRRLKYPNKPNAIMTARITPEITQSTIEILISAIEFISRTYWVSNALCLPNILWILYHELRGRDQTISLA